MHRHTQQNRRRRDRGRKFRHQHGRLHRSSTKIYDRETGEVMYGLAPAGSVAVSGNFPSPDGKYSLNCAVIVKRADAKTRAKTSLNDLLRN